MKIITNLAIPNDVYLFYYELAKYLPDCTTEDIIVDALERYMKIVTSDIIREALHENSDNTPLTFTEESNSIFPNNAT